MTTLVIGASGATGRLLVEQLLQRGERVKVIVRAVERLPKTLQNHANISILEASLLDLSDDALAEYVSQCEAVVSCLGHTLSLRGVFGPPFRLVTNAVRRLCLAIKANQPAEPVLFLLMNSAGVRNRGLIEPISFGQKCVISLLRILVPPHLDNEMAAEFLRTNIGQNDPEIEWAAIRPDSLINAEEVSQYALHASPTRSAIFNAGKTSRINVGHFMADLITDRELRDRWKGQMPVIYNE